MRTVILKKKPFPVERNQSRNTRVGDFRKLPENRREFFILVVEFILVEEMVAEVVVEIIIKMFSSGINIHLLMRYDKMKIRHRTFSLLLFFSSLILQSQFLNGEVVIDSLRQSVVLKTTNGLLAFGIIKTKTESKFDIRLLDSTLSLIKRSDFNIASDPVQLDWVKSENTLTIFGENSSHEESFVLQYNTTDLHLISESYNDPQNKRYYDQNIKNKMQSPTWKIFRKADSKMLTNGNTLFAIERDTFDVSGNSAGKMRTLLRRYELDPNKFYPIYKASWETELENYSTDMRVINRSDGKIFVFATDSSAIAKCMVFCIDETNGILLYKTPIVFTNNPALFFSHSFYDHYRKVLLIGGAYSNRSAIPANGKKALPRLLTGSFFVAINTAGKINGSYQSNTFSSEYMDGIYANVPFEKTWPCIKIQWIGMNDDHDYIVVYEKAILIPGYPQFANEGAIPADMVGFLGFSQNLKVIYGTERPAHLQAIEKGVSEMFPPQPGLKGIQGEKFNYVWPSKKDFVLASLRDTISSFISDVFYLKGTPFSLRILMHLHITDGNSTQDVWKVSISNAIAYEPRSLNNQTFGEPEICLGRDSYHFYRIRQAEGKLFIELNTVEGH